MLLAVVGVVYGAWAVYNSLDVEIQYWEDKKAYDHGVIQGLKDIREAENAFVKVKGRYTDDIEGELTRFVDERVIPVPQTEGMFIEGQGL